VKPQMLPPTKSAAQFHFLRVHLQVIECKTLMNVQLHLQDWGWRLQNNSYEPIMIDLEPEPEKIIHFVRL